MQLINITSYNSVNEALYYVILMTNDSSYIRQFVKDGLR